MSISKLEDGSFDAPPDRTRWTHCLNEGREAPVCMGSNLLVGVLRGEGIGPQIVECAPGQFQDFDFKEAGETKDDVKLDKTR